MGKGFFSEYIFNRKWIFRYMVVLFIVSLIPLVYISRYSHPSADDFSNGNYTVHTWRETGSISHTLSAAVEGTRYIYDTWQGSFIAVFLMTLHPAVFNEDLYMFGIIAIILGFVAATMFFLKVVFMDYLKMDKYSYGIIGILFTFISVQFIFCPVEGFYWYNAAMYYTGFHSVSLVLFALTLRAIKTTTISKTKIIYGIAVSLLASIVGGGNYVTALTSVIVMALLSAYCIFIKRSNRTIPILGTLSICAVLIIAIIAPGNAVRQTYFQSMNPILAIFMSFEYAFLFVGIVIRTPVWLAFACIVPLIYKVTRDSDFSFPYPIVVTILMYGIYASTFTPNLYSWSSFGPARVVNINFFAFLFFVLFSAVYCTGSIAHYMKRKPYKTMNMHSLIEHPIVTAVLVICFILGCAHATFVHVDSMASISAARSLATGEAQAYHGEYLARLELLRDPEIRHVELPEFTVKPRVLFHALDITTDPYIWPNTAVAQFHNKESVILIPRGDG